MQVGIMGNYGAKVGSSIHSNTYNNNKTIITTNKPRAGEY